MKIVRVMFLLGASVFAMGAVSGCGDDDDNGVDARTFDAPVSTVDAGAADAAGADAGGADAGGADAS